MTTIAMKSHSSFAERLASSSRSPEIPEEKDLYGWLAGSWELEVRYYWADVSKLGLKGEAHFARVLEGRAVQDVWIIPSPDGEKPGSYGTTLRVWDKALGAWRVTWINPVTGIRNDLIGRWQGKDIVQIGTHPDGTPIRWTFTEITSDSFVWKGEALDADGKTWALQGEFLARRI